MTWQRPIGAGAGVPSCAALVPDETPKAIRFQLHTLYWEVVKRVCWRTRERVKYVPMEEETPV